MRTIVILAHPHLESSSSQQFLLQTGQALTEVVYRDICQLMTNHNWQAGEELSFLGDFNRIIFQFPFYWYQAPAILKLWMDKVFSEEVSQEKLYQELHHKELGIVVIAGSGAASYQAGGKHNHTLSELLSPYQAFAAATGMKYLSPFSVHQFSSLGEKAKFQLMIEYAAYLETGMVGSFKALQDYLILKANTLDLSVFEMTSQESIIYRSLVNDIEERAAELGEFHQLNHGEW